MPTTLQYRPTLFDELISPARIASYQKVFQPANDVELMGVYLWNTHVCGALYPIIGTAEITLRNAIDHALRAHLGNFWWSGSKLFYKSFAPGIDPPWPVAAIRKNFASATQKFTKEQRERYGVKGSIRPNHHGIVAKTGFSTWEFILDPEFMGDKLVWPSRLGSVFKGAWPTSHASTLLGYARDLISTIRDFRNRLFHYEPAWKRFGVRTEADALQHLLEKIGKIESLLALINPESLRLLERNGLLDVARRACTAHEIRRFQHLTAARQLRSIEELQAMVTECRRQNSVLKGRLPDDQYGSFLIFRGA